MKNLKSFIAVSAFLLYASQSFAGLDWTYGALSNPDNLGRYTKAIAYSTTGNVYVTGKEENSSGNTKIVTKKISSTGSLLATVINTYAVGVGTTITDNATDIKLDANDNVYVLGTQYGTSSRGNDMVLIKYNSSLTQQWKKFIYNTNQPNNFDDKPCKILLDANNDVYVTGTWNNVTITGFMEEIFVQKYSASGTLLYSITVPQSIGKTISDVTDMCIDNSLNVTVCARAKNGSNIYSIMYARITNTGSLSWKKFYSPSSTFTLLFKPEVECLSTGTLYLSTISERETSGNNVYVRIATAKFNTSGTQQWEGISAEVHEYADNVILHLDASGNIYAGCDFLNSPAPSYKNHRIYKMNSSGTLQWIYTSAETSNFFSFETYASSSLFIIFSHTQGVNPILRKLDTSNGSVIWSETITYSPPATYHHCQVIHSDIAVNSSTSEVAFCGYISADMITPTYNQEYRWLIKKYGATSPRLSSTEINTENNLAENTFSVFPNPVNQSAIISWKSEENKNATTKIIDATGKEILKKELTSEQTEIDVSKLESGIYFVQLISGQNIQNRKIIVRH